MTFALASMRARSVKKDLLCEREKKKTIDLDVVYMKSLPSFCLLEKSLLSEVQQTKHSHEVDIQEFSCISSNFATK